VIGEAVCRDRVGERGEGEGIIHHALMHSSPNALITQCTHHLMHDLQAGVGMGKS
jgi:hypothetical protein